MQPDIVASPESSPSPSGSDVRDQAELDLQAAIDRVYRRYGGDLNAFFRDVQRDRREGRIAHVERTTEASSTTPPEAKL